MMTMTRSNGTPLTEHKQRECRNKALPTNGFVFVVMGLCALTTMILSDRLATRTAITMASSPQRRRLQQVPPSQPARSEVLFRPIMYTFYTPIEGSGARQAGMTQEAHENLLRVWRMTWQAAGWEPRVLTIQDAMRHPDYEQYNAALASTGASPYDVSIA